MKTFKPLLKFEEVKTDTSAGGGGEQKTQQGEQKTSTTTKESEAAGYNVEDRYKKTDPQQQTKQSDQTDVKKDEKKPVEENSAAGYGDDLEDVETAGYADKDKPEEKKEEKKSEEADDYKDLDVKDLDESLAKDIKEFAKLNKLPKEVAQALVNREKETTNAINEAVDKVTKEFKSSMETRQRQTRQKWQGELKADKEFGGEHFKQNLKRVDNVLEKFFPNVKNMLTTDKGMLPPSAMKDILNLHKVLFKDDKIVTGEQVAGEIDPIEARYSKTK